MNKQYTIVNKYLVNNKYSAFHVPQAIHGQYCQMGFADYLLGCIGLLKAMEHYNISDTDVICDYREHPINMFIYNSIMHNYTCNEPILIAVDALNHEIRPIYKESNFLYLLKSKVFRKLFIKNNIIQIISNKKFEAELSLSVTSQLKQIITPRNNFLHFLNCVKDRYNLYNYNVLHIRMGDLSFSKIRHDNYWKACWQKRQDTFLNHLFANFLDSYDFSTPLLVISDCREIKEKITNNYNKVIKIDNDPVHLGFLRHYNCDDYYKNVRDTLIDFFLIGNAKETFSIACDRSSVSSFCHVACRIFGAKITQILASYKRQVLRLGHLDLPGK